MAVVIIALLAVTVPAHAQITMRFSPPDTTIAAAGFGRLSIMLDDAIDVRTINLVVTYDTTIVKTVTGGPGALYTDSGLFVFQGFEEDTLGEWNGYAVIMASGQAIYGPGEIYWWDFETVAQGVTPVVSVAADLSDINGDWYSDVSLSPTTIVVGDPLSAVTDLPALPTDLRLWPNPFNPRTSIGFDFKNAGNARLAVYDAAGRRVADLFDGTVAAGARTFQWDGRDDRGAALAGGLYLFRLTTDRGIARARGILLK